MTARRDSKAGSARTRSEPAKVRIVVVDDHPVVREGLVASLEDCPDFEVVAAVGNADEGIAALSSRGADVVLLDLELPGTDGVAAIPQLREARPGARVIVLTAYDTDERVVGAVRSGASGYLLKGASLDDIARAIRAVHRGGSYLEPRVASKVMLHIRGQGRTQILSGRERQVLRLIADGLATKQIARELGITERTVKFHVSSILNKLGADTRAQAVALAARRGLLAVGSGG